MLLEAIYMFLVLDGRIERLSGLLWRHVERNLLIFINWLCYLFCSVLDLWLISFQRRASFEFNLFFLWSFHEWQWVLRHKGLPSLRVVSRFRANTCEEALKFAKYSWFSFIILHLNLFCLFSFNSFIGLEDQLVVLQVLRVERLNTSDLLFIWSCHWQSVLLLEFNRLALMKVYFFFPLRGCFWLFDCWDTVFRPL